MFGLNKKNLGADKLAVQVHVTASNEAFALAHKLWSENVRTLHTDATSHKDYLHFGYVNPPCVAWLQRDKGRADVFELIVRWERDKTHEVFVIFNSNTRPNGDDTRAKAILNSMLITPSIVLTGN